MDLGTGEFLITRDNVTSESTLGLYDPDYQARRVISKPRFPKRAEAK